LTAIGGNLSGVFMFFTTIIRRGRFGPVKSCAKRMAIAWQVYRTDGGGARAFAGESA
jgi:hypothetical protein